MGSMTSREATRASEAFAAGAVLTVAMAGAATGLFALADLFIGFSRELRLLSLTVVPAAPIVQRAIDGLLRKRRTRRRARARSAWSWAVGIGIVLAAGVLLAPAGLGALLLAGLVMALIWFGHTPERTAESILVLLTSVAVALTGLCAHPGRVSLGLLLLVILLAVVALVFVHGREVRRSVAGRSGRAAARPESRVGGLFRAVSAAGLACGVILLLPVLIGAEKAVLNARAGLSETPPDEPELRPGDVAPRKGEGGASGGRGSSGDGMRYPEGLPAGVRDPNAPAESFGEVRVFGAETAGAPFLLRGNVLGLATESGFAGMPPRVVHTAAAVPPAHAGVGPLFDVGPDAGGPEVVLEIRHPAISFAGDDRLVLVVAGTHAVRMVRPSAVRGRALRRLHQPTAGVFSIPQPYGGLQVVETSVAATRFADSVAGGAGRTGRRVRHDDPRWTALPTRVPSISAIAAFTGGLVSGAGSVDDVRNLVAFLRRDFVYDTTVSFEGLASVERLLNERRGFCQHFALAATVMLRSVGLPARTATGYLVNDWDRDSRSYEVWSTDRHAWVEVHVEGVGWVPFDVTPPSVLSDLRRLRGEEPGEDESTAPDDLEPFLTAMTLDRVIDRLIAGPAKLARLAARRLDLTLLVLGALGLLVIALLWTGRVVRRRLTGPVHLPDTRWTILLAALAEQGLRPRTGETPRQFARSVVRGRGSRFQDLVAIVDLFYRARFGRRPLTADEELLVDTFTASIS